MENAPFSGAELFKFSYENGREEFELSNFRNSWIQVITVGVYIWPYSVIADNCNILKCNFWLSATLFILPVVRTYKVALKQLGTLSATLEGLAQRSLL